MPHVEHPNSCYKFLHCQPAINGSYIYAVKTCYPDMMFNPTNMICDWPASVQKIKPQCGIDVGEIEIWETEEIIMKRRKSSKIPATTQRSVYVSSKRPIVVEYVETIVPYYIRQCSPSAPLIDHPESCNKYLQCEKLLNGSFVYAEKSCGSDLMFNPETKDCTWPDDVALLKPECRDKPVLIETWDLKVVTTQKPFVPTQRPFIPTEAPIIIPSTLTPPMLCDQGVLVPILNQLPDTAITASSFLGNAFKPENARLESKPGDKSGGSWSPKTNDLNQFLQITFPHALPIYGVIIRGNPMFDQYVTSFKILHSYDDGIYHVHEGANNRPQIFSGSVDPKTPVKTIFTTPIEAKIIRIYPISWHSSIALRAELLGCQRPSQPIIFPAPTQPPVTTQKPATKPPPPVVIFVPTNQAVKMFTEAPLEPLCDDPLGVENGKMSPTQIKFSSIKDSGSVKTKVRKNPIEIIKLSSVRGWMPLADSMNEFVMVRII